MESDPNIRWEDPQDQNAPRAGAYIQTEYVGVRLDVYPISEDQIETLSLFNGATAVCASVRLAAITFAASVKWDMSNMVVDTAAKTPHPGDALFWVCLIFGIALLVAAKLANDKNLAVVERIKRRAIRTPALPAVSATGQPRPSTVNT